ncbi:MAG: ADP-ribosyl-[dinitrogen reductase] hydrolase [Magnetovibrionaceae bacterium]
MPSASSIPDQNLDRLKKHARGAYLGLAVGDALGATVEFMTPREIQAKHGTFDSIVGGGWLNLKRGQVTDDTEMTLALGRAILDAREVEGQSCAKAFSDWMATKPVDMGNTVRRGVVHWRQTGKAAVAENEHDGGNGAAMRCLPIALAGVFADADWRRQAHRTQGHVTHNNHQSDIASDAIIEIVRLGLVEEHSAPPLEPARALVDADKAFDWSKRRQENPSGYIVDTMKAVIQACQERSGFEAILIDVVNRGGDADTTGAIAGMIAGATFGEDGIPDRWLIRLDPEVAKACRDQADALIDLARSRVTG